MSQRLASIRKPRQMLRVEIDTREFKRFAANLKKLPAEIENKIMDRSVNYGGRRARVQMERKLRGGTGLMTRAIKPRRKITKAYGGNHEWKYQSSDKPIPLSTFNFGKLYWSKTNAGVKHRSKMFENPVHNSFTKAHDGSRSTSTSNNIALERTSESRYPLKAIKTNHGIHTELSKSQYKSTFKQVATTEWKRETRRLLKVEWQRLKR